VEAFWLILVGVFVISRVLVWQGNKQHYEERRREREFLKTFTDKAAEEHPELVGAYWNPKRIPVPRDLRPKVFARTKGKCFYCDKSLSDLSDWQVDHMWPYRYGGSEDFINLVPSCKGCNEEKWSHLPPRYLLHKWVVGMKFTTHEMKFLEFYRNNSMANLIGTSAYWKGRANHWHATIFPEFVDLILKNEGIKNASGKRRDELLTRAQDIYDKLDCDITKRTLSYTAIQNWLDSDRWLEDALRKNRELDD